MAHDQTPIQKVMQAFDLKMQAIKLKKSKKKKEKTK